MARLHNAEGKAIREMISPSQQMGIQGICGLRVRLPQNHRTKRREYFEEVHCGDERFQSPLPGENKGQPENIVRDGGEQPRDCANQNRGDNGFATARVNRRPDSKQSQSRQENCQSKKAHRTNAVELREQTKDGGGSQQPDTRPLRQIPGRWGICFVHVSVSIDTEEGKKSRSTDAKGYPTWVGDSQRPSGSKWASGKAHNRNEKNCKEPNQFEGGSLKYRQERLSSCRVNRHSLWKSRWFATGP